MSRRNRTIRRRTYGKRQHEVRERRPNSGSSGDWRTRDDGWTGPEPIEDARRHDDGAFDTLDGWAR